VIYALLRAAAGIALRWFYRDVEVQGRDRVPRGCPLLVVVNHPNALVDALIIGWILPRRVLITAKATIFRNPIAGALLSWLGVLRLRRVSDERVGGDQADPTRNRETFRAVERALAHRRAVLIFPEGKSHDEPALAPLKTGAARMALQARDDGGVQGLMILPVGLTFERKESPRSRVYVQVGEPIAMDTWRGRAGVPAVESLTDEIEARLRAVTLNYASTDDAARAAALSSVVAALFADVRPLDALPRLLSTEAGIARRIHELTVALAGEGGPLRDRADRLAQQLRIFRRFTADRGLFIEDIGISTDLASGIRFVVREAWLLALAGPFAVWGKVNHWLPFNAARLVAMRSVETAADPAMRTIVAGAGLVLVAYLAQAVAVAALFGRLAAAVYLASLPVAADVNFYLSERLARALTRARAFRAFRRDPTLHRRLQEDVTSLRRETLALEAALRERPLAISL